jgi:hypothetical protein
MTLHDGILAGDELAPTGQDHLSELRAWLRAYPDDQLVRDELRQLASDLDITAEVADRREAAPITEITGNLPRSLLSVAGLNGAILTEGSVALLAGAGGVGKSALMVSLALGVACLPDGQTGSVVEGICDGVGGPVILVTYEDMPEVTAWRVRSLVSEMMQHEAVGTRQEAFSRIYVIDLLGRPLFGPMSAPGRSASYNAPPGPLSGWSDLWLAAGRIKPSLIIIDPALSAFSGESNAAAPVREFLGALALKAKALGTGVLLTAHSNKAARSNNQDPYDPGQVGGSAAWVDGARGVLAMTRQQSDDDTNASSPSELQLAVAKSNYGPSLVTVGLSSIRTAGGAIVGFRADGSWSGPGLNYSSRETVQESGRKYASITD